MEEQVALENYRRLLYYFTQEKTGFIKQQKPLYLSFASVAVL